MMTATNRRNALKRAEANAKYGIHMAISLLFCVPIAIVNQTVITTKINLLVLLKPYLYSGSCDCTRLKATLGRGSGELIVH